MKVLLVSAFCTFVAFLQCQSQSSRLELGFGGGVSAYQGDLTPATVGTINKPGFGFQVLLNYTIHRAFTLRGNFTYTLLKEDESSYPVTYHQRRNFKFETAVNELSALLIFSPLLTNGEEEAGNITPYIFGGAGIGFLRIKRDWSAFDRAWPGWQQWVRDGLLKDTMTALPESILTLPVGAGLRYAFGENVSLYTETAHRFTQNGYIDGFSMAANPKKHDSFTTLTIGLIFKLTGGAGGRGGRGGYGCPVNVW